jgi:endoglucanase
MLALTAGCGGEPEQDRAPDAQPTRPQAVPSLPPVFYVDPYSPASEQSRVWAEAGRQDDAAELLKISQRPTARWLTGERIEAVPVRDAVDTFVGQAAIAGQLPVLVVHYLPERDCGRSGSGGAPSAEAYRSWIREVAAGIARRPVIVIVEPNAVPDAVAGCVRDVEQRYALLRDAVAVLAGTGSARIYLDAGHPHWIKDVGALAAALKRAGIADARGFALNVANFVRTADNVSYGHRLSDALGGTVPFVIDTSRNGNGPYPGDTVDGAPSWCNPPGRALGEPPTDNPGLPRVDALLWIKYPGESDGSCRPGEPEVGAWWPEYALDLARRSS